MKFTLLSIFMVFSLAVSGQELDTIQIKKAKDLYSKGEKYIFKNKDSAYYFFNKSYQIFKRQQDWLNSIYALKGVSLTSSYHYDLKKYKYTLESIDSIMKKRNEYLDTIAVVNSIKNHNLVEKANYFIKIKKYKESRLYSTKLWERIEDLPDNLRTKGNYKRLCMALEFGADSYKHEGEYIKAEELYKKSLRIILAHLDKDFALPTYRLLGDLYRKQGKYAQSNVYLSKGLDYEIKKGTSSKNKIVKSCFAIAENHIHMKSPDSTRYYLNIAYQQLLENDPLEYQYHQILGKSYLSEGKIEKALAAINTSIDLSTAKDPEYKQVQIARLYKLKARVLHQNLQYQEALQNLQLALKQLSRDFNPKEVKENPDPESVPYTLEYLKVLKEKAHTLATSKDFLAVLETCTTAITVMDRITPTFQNEEDKQFLIEHFYPIFETGIASAFQLYQQTKDIEYIDTAFFLSEKSKSAILLEALLNAKAYKFANIPQALLEKEQQLRASITYLQKKVTKKGGKQWEEPLFAAKEKYEDFIRELEQQYPRYHDLKYNQKVVSLADFQNRLNRNTMAVSYFYGKEQLYVITISRNTKTFSAVIKTEALNDQLKEFRKAITDPGTDISELQFSANTLYQKLIPADLQNTSLIIIPDGILNYIPFESFYDGTKYLVEKAMVSYVNSATLLTQLQQKEPINTEVLAFAPRFSEKYPELTHSKKEVSQILSCYSGTSFKGAEATLEHFLQQSPSYGIIHLATHALIEDHNPGDTHLIFASKTSDTPLYLGDIYNLNVDAALISLSACKTGVGNLTRGEGMISLARAFFYAGAASIASTQWQVNDRSTSEIMQAFYEYLSKGKEKDEALRLAKVDFLEKNDDNGFRHPYFWAGIAITGDTIAIPTSTTNWLWVFVAGIILLAGIWWIRKKKRS